VGFLERSPQFLEVSANYLKAVDLFGRDRKNSVRFAVSQLAYDFRFQDKKRSSARENDV